MATKRLPYYFLIISFVLLSACNVDYDSNEPSQLVVEGWIDNGDFPMVFVTRSVPISDEYQDISELGQYLERWAKVTISDGEREEVMVGRLNSSYYPPFYYTTSYMRGEPGKTYRLHVESSKGLTADAETSITPETAVIDSFWVTPVEGNDTLYQLHAHINLEASTAQYFKVFTQTNLNIYTTLSSMFGVFSRDMIGNGDIIINKGRKNLDKDYISSFSINDTVQVKLAALSEAQYHFWRSFEDMISLSRNPLFPATDNMPSNVSTGMGCWFGYTSNHYYVPIRSRIK
jgi:hypothetical protein